MNLKSRIVTVALTGTLLIAGAAGTLATASAQEPSPSPAAEATAPHVRFLERVASALGIDVERLRAAITRAHLELVDDAEANGRITAERADALRERINSGEGLGLGRFIRRQVAEERLHRFRVAFVVSAAEAIGIEPRELRDQLIAGDSIADVAAENGVALEDVKQHILDAAQAKAGEAVANGRITQQQADRLMQRITNNIDEWLQRSREAPAD